MAKLVNHRTEKKVKAMKTKAKRLRVPKESPMLDIDDKIKHEVRAANRRLAKSQRPVGSIPVMSLDQVELGYYEFYDYKINDKKHQFLRAYVWIDDKPEMVIGSGQDTKAAARTILAKYNQRNKTSKSLYRSTSE